MHVPKVSSFVAFLAITGVTSALKQSATFDDITVVPGVPELNAITTYQGLSYQGWDVASVTLGVLGVKPASTPNVISHALVKDVQATAFGFSIANTTTKSFDLYGFYFGCVASSQNSEVNVAQPCTITVQGYKTLKSQTAVATKTTTYQAKRGGPNVKDMFHARFPKEFRNLAKIRIRQVESLSGEVLNAVVLDNVIYALNT